MALSQGHDAVCLFVNDKASATVIEQLAANGIKIIALRCAGFNMYLMMTCVPARPAIALPNGYQHPDFRRKKVNLVN